MKKTLAFIVGLFFLVMTLEIGSLLYLHFINRSNDGSMSGGISQKKSWKNLPYNIPLTAGRVIRTIDGRTVILDVPYSIDRGSRRTSLPPQGESKEFLLFVGCSFTFGSGVLDHETLPSQTQKNIANVRVYNYGVGGASPQEILLRLMHIDRSEMDEADGRVIYSFIPGHLLRFFWHPDFVGSWGKFKNVYQFQGSEFKNLGPYSKLHPYLTWFYTLRMSSSFYHFLNISSGPSYSEDQMNDFFAHLKLMNQQARRITGTNMIVLLWPDSTISPEMKEFLKAESMPVLDYSSLDLEKLTHGRPRIPIDGHPSVETYAVMGSLIAKDLSAIRD